MRYPRAEHTWPRRQLPYEDPNYTTLFLGQRPTLFSGSKIVKIPGDMQSNI